MRLIACFAATTILATPASAQETRQLDAHEHGVGQLDVAIDGQQIAMALHAPGADIVGFEHAAENDADRAAVEAALATLAEPLALFVLPDAAGCSVEQAKAELEGSDGHEAHGDEHDDDDHGHDDHAHDDENHDGHEEEHHAEDGHDEHHDEHSAQAGHNEFLADYLLTCADPAAITDMTFAYFDSFPNALEVDVQIVTDAGAASFEVTRAAPTLDLRGAF